MSLAVRCSAWFALVLLFFVPSSPAGQPVFEWLVQSETPVPGETSFGQSVTVDTENNFYVGGTGTPGIHLGKFRFSSRSRWGTPFFAKYSPEGSLIWVSSTPTDRLYVYGIQGANLAVSSTGNIYVPVEQVVGNNLSGPTTLLKFDASGLLVWRRSLLMETRSVVTDLTGNLFAAGHSPVDGISTIVKYDPELQVIWSFTPEDLSHLINFTEIVADGDSNLLVTGSFSGGIIKLGPYALTNTNLNEQLPFLAKFDNEGRPIWLTLASTNSYATVSNPGVDSAGSCHLIGTYQSQDTGEFRSFVSKYSSQGQKLWSRELSDPPNQIAASHLAVSTRGDLLVTGTFRGGTDNGRSPVNFLGSTLISAGGDDMFVSKFNSLGEFEWVFTLGSSSGVDIISGIAWSTEGIAEMTGSISESTVFANLGQIEAEQNRMFLARLTESPKPPSIVSYSPSQRVASGDRVVLQMMATGTPMLSFAWRKNDLALTAVHGDQLVLTNFQSGDAGIYSVVVSSPFGSVTSNPAILTLGYSLEVSVDGNGTVSRLPDLPSYVPGTSVELTATPGDLDDFLGWSGDASGNATTTTVLLDTNRSVIAHFVNTALQLSSVGNGSITQTPSQSHYHLGDFVRLTAVPDRWFRFSHWEDGSISNPRTIAVGTNNHFTASFEPAIPLETLNFDGISRLAPVGMPAVFANGVFTTNLTLHSVGPISIGLTTSFDHGLIFYSLDGSPPTLLDRISDGRPFLLTRSATLRVIAVDETFSQMEEWDSVRIEIEPGYQLHLTSGRGGTVTASPKLTESTYYSSNLVVNLSAIPNEGSTFLQWLGDAEGTNPTVSMTMNRDRCVEAIFGTTLRRVSSTGGILQISPELRVYPYDSIVDLTAIADSGNTFAVWSGAVHGATNPVRFTITQAVPTIAAGFATLPPGESALTVFQDGLGTVSVHPPGNRFRTSANVTLTAVPDEDQSFIGWAGDASGTKNPIQISMNQTRRIIARFTKRPRLVVSDCPTPADPAIFVFQLFGEPGAQYQIESATNPAGPWTHVSTLTDVFGKVQTAIPVTARIGNFFRASLVQ